MEIPNSRKYNENTIFQNKKNINWRPVVFNEIWKPITQDVVPYVLPYYYISSYGRIYSAVSEKYIILTLDQDGYVNVNLHTEPNSHIYSNRKRDQISCRVHRLVLATFAPVDNWQNLECNHKDSVRSNNYLYNLEWVTAKENRRHGIENGYVEIININGVLNPCAKLTKSQVLEIVDILNQNVYNYEEIGRMYNVSGNIIRDIAAGRHWSSVTEGLINKDVAIRLSRVYSNEELKSILNFFENKKDVLNDKSVYPSLNSIVEDCLNETGLIEKHPIESTRKTIVSYLRKTNYSARELYKKYTYNYYG